MTDINETVARWRRNVNAVPAGTSFAKISRADLCALLDAAEAGERARDAALRAIASEASDG
jgi:hypothetical protein